jgi:ribosomal protein S18 acetylase RimI-like enzyme
VEAARPATPSDLPHLVALATDALAELAPLRGGAVFVHREGRAAPVEETLRRDLESPEAVVLAGTIDDAVVGYATGRTEALRDGTTLGVIDDLYVDEGARSVGVGEAMMGELLAWFRERGCAGVDATALPGNRATKNFFEESGFTARLLVMHHRLT